MTSSNPPSGDGPARRRPSGRRRVPALTVAGLVLVGIATIVLATLLNRPAGTDHAGRTVSTLIPSTTDAATIVVRAVLTAATAAVAGLALARVLAPPPGTDAEQAPVPGSVQVAAWVSAFAAGMACVAAVLTGQAAAPVAASQMALALAVPLVIADRRRLWPSGLLGVLLAGVLGVEFSGGQTVTTATLEVVYAIAGAVLLGISAFAVARLPGREVAVAERAAGRSRPLPDTTLRRAAPGLAVLVAVTGIARLLVAGPGTLFDVMHTGYGITILIQGVLPLLVTAAWVAATAPRTRPRAELIQLSAGGLVLSLLAAAMVGAFPLPLPAPQPGTPLLRPVEVGLRHLAVMVLPMRPGPNLVHIGDAGDGAAIPDHQQHGAPAAGTSSVSSSLVVSTGRPDPVPALAPPPGPGAPAPVPVLARPGAPGGWAVIDLPAGSDRLYITGDGITATAPIDVGTDPGDTAVRDTLAGPDGPECASAVLGRLLAAGDPGSSATRDGPPACPAQALSDSDAGTVRDTVAFLAGRGITALHLVSDGSVRSRAAADLARAEAAAHHLPISTTASPGDTLFAVSGWATAADALATASKIANGEPGGGIVLAPWLLTTRVLGSATSEVVGLPFNPQNDQTREYAATVNAVFPGETPSTAGDLAWAEYYHTPMDPRSTFYGAAQINVPMGAMDDDMNMNGQASDWYLGGSVVPINPPVSGPPGPGPAATTAAPHTS